MNEHRTPPDAPLAHGTRHGPLETQPGFEDEVARRFTEDDAAAENADRGLDDHGDPAAKREISIEIEKLAFAGNLAGLGQEWLDRMAAVAARVRDL